MEVELADTKSGEEKQTIPNSVRLSSTLSYYLQNGLIKMLTLTQASNLINQDIKI